VPDGEITEAGLRWNIDVGLQYLAAWLKGNGCVPIYNLMEDAATCEICRTQVWQWVKHGANLSDGRAVTPQLVRQAASEELEKLRHEQGAERFDSSGFQTASQIFEGMMTSADFPEFLTLVAYDHID
jgi:malate synthase